VRVNGAIHVTDPAPTVIVADSFPATTDEINGLAGFNSLHCANKVTVDVSEKRVTRCKSRYGTPLPFAAVFQPSNAKPDLRKAFGVNILAVPETIARLLIVPDVDVFPLKIMLKDRGVQIA
jgi:hypothetical protein